MISVKANEVQETQGKYFEKNLVGCRDTCDTSNPYRLPDCRRSRTTMARFNSRSVAFGSLRTSIANFIASLRLLSNTFLFCVVKFSNCWIPACRYEREALRIQTMVPTSPESPWLRSNGLMAPRSRVAVQAPPLLCVPRARACQRLGMSLRTGSLIREPGILA